MNAISANDAALRAHISQQQDLACRLLGILKGIEVLDIAGSAPDAVSVMIEVGKKMADDLYINLDSASLPDTEPRPQ